MIRICLAFLALTFGHSWAGAQECGRLLPDQRIARGDKNIAEAWLADPTTRYRHFVLGSDYEAATLCVRQRGGATLRLTLPETTVFEDRQPRLADLDGDGRDEIVVVRSTLKQGAALAVASIVSGELRIIAETPPTGSPHTWINPAGIADFDGDGRLNIAVASPLPGDTPPRHEQPRAPAHYGPEVASWRGCSVDCRRLVAHD